MNRVVTALVLPLLALLGWCGWLEWKLISGREVRVAIEGYDPRDLLSGHYIQYSLALNQPEACTNRQKDQDVCICLDTNPTESSYSIGTWSGTCSDRPSACTVYLRGRCEGPRFSADVERYYIPESLAPVLSRVPENASVVLKLDDDGLAHVKRVLVNQQSIEEYATQVIQSAPQTVK
jgi:uncharacterized membrane-anchored protein